MIDPLQAETGYTKAQGATWSERRGGAIVVFAISFAIGIVAGYFQPETWSAPVWPWIIAAAALALGAAATIGARRFIDQRFIFLMLALAMFALGAARYTLKQRYADASDLAAMIGDTAMMVHVRGTALSEPVVRHRTGGAMARFDYRQPSTYFPMRVEALIGRDGAMTAVQGEVLVRIDEPVVPFHAGDLVTATGFLMKPQAPRNPGEFDYREYARSLGQAGFLTIAQRELLNITPVDRNLIQAKLMQWRDELRRRAGAWLLADLPQSARSERDSLLVSILLGQRDEQIDGVYGSFQRVGLAHVLAISGFHLGVLAGFVLLCARLIAGPRRWHGWLVIAFVLLYLTLVEARMPVLRAGVMTILASLGLLFSRRLKMSGLLWISAIALLWWRPDQLFDAGFQLTYGVVLGLIHLAPRFRRRCFGEHEHHAATFGAMMKNWFYSSLAVAITAWLIGLPIGLYHFGTFSPLAVVLSIATAPLASIILALGFLKMALAVILPGAAMLVGLPLSITADLMLAIVMTVDKTPWAFIPARHPSTWWSIAALIWAAWFLIGDRWVVRTAQRVRRRTVPRNGATAGVIKDAAPFLPPMTLSAQRTLAKRARLIKWLFALGLIAIYFWPAQQPRLRIDMLAVGDGSCYVIRSGNSTVVFDAGSSTDLNVARRSLIPALRHLDVRNIDAIAITHADLDHYSAVVELAEAFHVKEILLTPQFLREAATERLGPVAATMDQINQLRIAARPISAGERRTFGHSTWTWLNPQPDRDYPRANNSSMVIRIDCGDRRVLMCGDIQRETMQELLRDRHDAIRADVIELPHHGSHNEVAERFIREAEPEIVLQSTGWSRWSTDKWARALANVQRFVTARDGACWIELDASGKWKSGCFVRKESPAAPQPRTGDPVQTR